MKSILLSIKPEWVAKILNGEKTIEIRKMFPKDYVGWVYIYCTKDNNNLLHKNCADIWWVEDKGFQKKNKRLGIEQPPILNGKVVARFWCDKVEEITLNWDNNYETKELSDSELLAKSCLDRNKLDMYLLGSGPDTVGYAIHIIKLEIFDKPKELSEFRKVGAYKQYQKDLEQANKEDVKLTDKRIKELDRFGESSILANSTELLECAWHLGAYGITKAPQNFMYIDIN